MIGWPFDRAPVNVSHLDSGPAAINEPRRTVGFDRGQIEAERIAAEARAVADDVARETVREFLSEQGRAYLECGG